MGCGKCIIVIKFVLSSVVPRVTRDERVHPFFIHSTGTPRSNLANKATLTRVCFVRDFCFLVCVVPPIIII